MEESPPAQKERGSEDLGSPAFWRGRDLLGPGGQPRHHGEGGPGMARGSQQKSRAGLPSLARPASRRAGTRSRAGLPQGMRVQKELTLRTKGIQRASYPAGESISFLQLRFLLQGRLGPQMVQNAKPPRRTRRMRKCAAYNYDNRSCFFFFPQSYFFIPKA